MKELFFNRTLIRPGIIFKGLVLCVMNLCFTAHHSWSQLTLGPPPYIQDFNSIGGGLPAGWTVRTAASASAVGIPATFSSSASSWSSATGNFRNVAAAAGLVYNATTTAQSNSVNRSLGIRQTSTFGDPGAAFVLQLDNTAELSNFSLSFTLESLDGSAAGRTTAWIVEYAFGSSPGSFFMATTSPAVLSTTLATVGVAWGSVHVNVNFGNQLDNKPGNVWIRIVTLSSATGTGSRPTTAIDDFQLNYVTPDVTAPVFASTYPKTGNLTSSGFDLFTQLNESGKTYFVILPEGATAPSSVQVKNGLDGEGISLDKNLTGVLPVLPATESYTTVTGLVASTTYDVYVFAEDTKPNLQVAPVKISLTTSGLYAEDFNSCTGTGSFTLYNVTGLQTWQCTDFGRGSKGIWIDGSSGVGVINEDWLILPLLGLSTRASLSFYSQFTSAGNILKLKISTDYSGADNPRVATWKDLNGNFPLVPVSAGSTSLTDWTFSIVDLSGYAGQNVHVAFVYTSTSSAAARWTLDDINLSGVEPGYLKISSWTSNFNSPGIKSYTIQGFKLQGDVTITAPEYFEVSRDGNVFGHSISYSSTEANVQKRVYVKFSAGIGNTTKALGLITHESPGMIRKALAITGTDLSQTFDVATFNLEFFGTNVNDTNGLEFGPMDNGLQADNVSSVIKTIGADIYAVEEISDDAAFERLVNGLPGYGKIVSDHWSHAADPPDPNFPPQKIGFVFDTTTVRIIEVRSMFAKLYQEILAGTAELPYYPGGNSSSFWASGRLPWMVLLKVNINESVRQIRMIGVHAKSGTQQINSDRRRYDMKMLYDSLILHYQHDDIILLGDFNDDARKSSNTQTSSYKAFEDDVSKFDVLTNSLSQIGDGSFPNAKLLLDHIIISNELTNSYVRNSIAIEDARVYIPDYINTTSDHLPVSARFLLGVKSDQMIIFDTLAEKILGDAPLKLAAETSSGLSAIFVSSDSTIASLQGNTLTILNAGTVNITARQEGNNQFNPAQEVLRKLVINKADQTITFGELGSHVYSDTSFVLEGTSSSLLPLSYVGEDVSVVTLAGNTLKITGAGTTIITASQPGNKNYNPATDVQQTFVVKKSNQTLSFNSIPDMTVGDPIFFLSATSNSNLPVNFVSISDKISMVDNRVAILNSGRTSIGARQAGNKNYEAAISIDRSFCINPSRPTVVISNSDPASPILTSSAKNGIQWYLNDQPIEGATNAAFHAMKAGVYKVQAKEDDCVSEFSSNTEIIITGELQSAINPLIIYPNPTGDFLYVRCPAAEITRLQILNILGCLDSATWDRQGESYRVPVQHLSSGIYFLLIKVNDEIILMKFIKE